jgi:predicted permease
VPVAIALGIAVGLVVSMLGLLDLLLHQPPQSVASPGNLVALTRNLTYGQFESIQSGSSLNGAAYRPVSATLDAGGVAREVRIECVSPNYFQVVGAPASAGRVLSTDDHLRPVAVVSEAALPRGVTSSSSAVGALWRINGVSFTVVGVVPATFSGLLLARPVLWIPITAAPEVCSQRDLAETTVRTVLRIGEADTRESALVALQRLFHDRPERGAPTVESPLDLESLQAARTPLARRESTVTRWALGAACLVLLIAGLNAAGLLTLALIGRRQELVIRRQLGATRTHLVLGLIKEHLPLLVLMCAAALAVHAGISRLQMTALSSLTPGRSPVDEESLLMIVGIALSAFVSSIVVPIWYSSRVDASPTSGSAVLVTPRSAGWLLVGQTALAFSLVVGTGLLVKSVSTLLSDSGFRLNNVKLITLDVRGSDYRTSDAARLYARATQRVSGLDGVTAVALSSGSLLRAGDTTPMISVQRVPRDELRPPAAAMQDRSDPRIVEGWAGIAAVRAVSENYFAAIGTTIQRGRGFSTFDSVDSPLVSVIDETLAREIWLDEDALGRCLYVGRGSECIRIVGIAESRRNQFLTQVDFELFLPLTQAARHSFARLDPQSLVVQLEDPSAEALVGSAVRSMSSDITPIMWSLEAVASDQLRSWRLGAQMFAGCGIMGLLMGAVGLYATLAFGVRQRTRELGLRLALGASRFDVVATIARGTLWAVPLGIGVGVLIIATCGSFAQSLLFELHPLDTGNLLVSAIGLALMLLAGASLPAWRASTVDPSVVLREG